MPIFEFKCELCGHVEEFDKNAGTAIREETGEKFNKCPNCLFGWMKRVYTPPGIVWHCSRPTPYSKGDKEKKMEDVPDD